MSCYPCPIPKPGETVPHTWVCGATEQEAVGNLVFHIIEGHWNAPVPSAGDLNIDLEAETQDYLTRLKDSLEKNISIDADVAEARRRS